MDHLKQKIRRGSGGRKCCIKNCNSKSIICRNRTNIKFTRFPRNPKKAAQLLEQLNITMDNISNYKERRVCSKHFRHNCSQQSQQFQFCEEVSSPLTLSNIGNTVEIESSHVNTDTFPTVLLKATSVEEPEGSDHESDFDHQYYFIPNAKKFKNLQEYVNKLECENEHLKADVVHYAPSSQLNEVL